MIKSRLAKKFDDVQLDTVSAAITNKRLVATKVYATPNVDSNDTTVIDADLQKIKNLNVDSISITVKTVVDGTTISQKQTLQTLDYIYKKAKSMGLNTTIIRVSASSYRNSYDFITNWDYWSATYKAIVEDAIELFASYNDSKIEYFMPLNESEKIYEESYNHDAYVIELLTAAKTAGFKTSVSTEGYAPWFKISSAVIAECDCIALNHYFKLGVQGINTKVSESVDAINTTNDGVYASLLELANKPIIITETGCMPFWEALNSPGSFSSTGLTRDNKAMWMYWKSLFESNIPEKCESIGVWFYEFMWDEEIKQLFGLYLGGGAVND